MVSALSVAVVACASFTVGDPALTLPTPTYVGYTFNGWFTLASGGSLITSPYTPTADITIYAQWSAISAEL
ncbi:hypothetical protein BSN82_17155, partial [Acinetobacter baylyi]|uniref:InlB B-repeat-containing protein n=1 Tax=Acinetobacter baylyi TaxID=202950 RepID=UPI0013D35EE3